MLNANADLSGRGMFCAGLLRRPGQIKMRCFVSWYTRHFILASRADFVMRVRIRIRIRTYVTCPAVHRMHSER